MPSKSWAAIERLVASVTGGVRSWWSTTDVIVDDWGLEVKYLTAPTLAELERHLVKNQQKQAKFGRKAGLVVKRKGGRGKQTPLLLLVEIPQEEQVG